MKYFFTLIFALSILNLTALAQKPLPPPPPKPLIYNAPDKTDLKEFIPEDKTFQITFPSAPTITKQEAENSSIISYRVYRQGSNSLVNIVEFKNNVEGIKETIYDLAKNSYLKLPKSTIETEKDIQIDGREAREFDVLQDFNYQKNIILIVGSRVYEISSDVTNWHIIGDATKKQFFDETERFFSSFKHLKSSEAVLMPTPLDFLGEVDETNYKNAFFGFSLTFPESWHRSEEEEIEAGKKRGLELLKTDKEKINRAFEESVKKEVVVFSIADRSPTVSRGTNLGVGVLRQSSSQITAEMVADVSKKLFLTNPKITLIEDVKKININGVPFSTFTLQSDFNGVLINQKLFITIRKGYSIDFVFTYLGDDGLRSLEKIFENLKFDKK